MDEQFSISRITRLVLDKENPLEDMFQREEMWPDEVDYSHDCWGEGRIGRLNFISFVSNWPHPDITATEARQLKEYLGRTIIDEAERQYPKGERAQIYLPDGCIEWYFNNQYAGDKDTD